MTSVDKDHRIVSVKTASGKTLEMVADPAIKNFDQIKVGDHVHVEYIAWMLRRPGSLRARSAGSTRVIARAMGGRRGGDLYRGKGVAKLAHLRR